MIRLCKLCEFYSSGHVRVELGECRRLPPTVVAVSDYNKAKYSSDFPRVSETQWCGEFKKMEQ